jgi:hypothetical protein
MAARKYRRRRRRYPHAYARMTLRGPRVGVNCLPGCLIYLTVLATLLAAVLLEVT